METDSTASAARKALSRLPNNAANNKYIHTKQPATLAAGCFVWMYLLFAALLGSRLKAFLAALAVESVSMLLFCYWWYNNITSVAAVLFLLSCLLYLRNSDS